MGYCKFVIELTYKTSHLRKKLTCQKRWVFSLLKIMCDYVCNSVDAYFFFCYLTLVLHVYIIHYVLILLQDGILLFFVPSIKCMAYNDFHIVHVIIEIIII